MDFVFQIDTLQEMVHLVDTTCGYYCLIPGGEHSWGLKVGQRGTSRTASGRRPVLGSREEQRGVNKQPENGHVQVSARKGTSIHRGKKDPLIVKFLKSFHAVWGGHIFVLLTRV